MDGVKITINRFEFYAYTIHIYIKLEGWRWWTVCEVLDKENNKCLHRSEMVGIRPLFMAMFMAHDFYLDKENVRDEIARYIAKSIAEEWAEEEFKILHGDGTTRQPRGIIESNLTTTE